MNAAEPDPRTTGLLAGTAGRIFDGTWRTASGGTLDVTEKATGAVLTTTGLADASDVRAATAAARAAQLAWAALASAERAAVLRRAAAVLESARAEVVTWIVREGGATRQKADFEIAAVLDELWTAADIATRPWGTLLPAEPGHESIGRRVPLGVVGVISPWNMPLLLGMRALAPALALGNAVVLKPDARTAVAGGAVIARLFEEAGLPPGVLHVLPGPAEPGAALVSAPETALICFTGSTEVGREIGAAAGRSLKRASLELGGNNPLIVLEDADLEAAASAAAFGSFFHQGQMCMSTGRHLVHAAVADDYAALLEKRAAALRAGDPWTGDVDLGPMISTAQRDRVQRLVTDSVAAGARLHTGGTFDGPYYRPTVLSGVTEEMPICTEETFGPVAAVLTFQDEDEAVEIANRTAYGLSAAVQTGDTRRGVRLAKRLEAGLVHVNDQTIHDEAPIPFGGMKASGNGARFGAEQNWDGFTTWQWLTVREDPARYLFGAEE